MKKIVIIGMLALYSHLSTAQSSEVINSTDRDTTTAVSNKVSVEDRLNKQELDIEGLKKDKEFLKKQIKQNHSSLPNTKRKFAISRTGSKQLIVQ